MTIRHLLMVLLLAGLGAAGASPSAAQSSASGAPRLKGSSLGPEQPGSGTPLVTWRVLPPFEPVRRGEWAAIGFELDIAKGWHLYAMDSPAGRPLMVQFDSLPAGFSLDALRQRKPETGYDPNFRKDVRYFETSAVIQAGIVAGEGAYPGTGRATGRITYMVCNDDMCMPPRTQSFEVEIAVEPGAERTGYAQARWSGLESGPPPAPEAGGRSSAAGGGLATFLLLAAGAALVTLITPCVLPMVPLTVSYFSTRAPDRRGAVGSALLFGASIVVLFTSVGAVAGAVLGAAGAARVAANPWVNLMLGLALTAFALSLLGAFELRLPPTLLNYANRRSGERGGVAGTAFMALTMVLVSFSCTAPFVGGLMAAAAQGSWSRPLLGMLVYSVVLALPFVLLALFPGAVRRIPRSGQWMVAVKGVLGFVELAAALKFLSNVDLVMGWGLLPRPAMIALLMAIAGMAGLFILGKLGPGGSAEHASAGRLAGGVLSFGFMIYLLPGLLGGPLGWLDAYLPPRTSFVPAVEGFAARTPESLPWITDDVEAAFAEARQMNVPVFVDFTGYTCTNCREMEASVFPQPEVASRLRSRFVLLRLYTDGRELGPELQEYQLRLTGTVAMPTYAIVEPGGTLVGVHSGMASPAEFARFLDSETSGSVPAASRRYPLDLASSGLPAAPSPFPIR